MVSIKPVHALAAALMEGVASPEVIIAGSDTPYEFALSPDKAADLARADLVVWVGAELEAVLAKPLAGLPARVRVLRLLAQGGLKVLPSRGRPGAKDPYLWLDVRNAEVVVDALYGVLAQMDPERSGRYAENRAKLKGRIARLDREFEKGFRTVVAGRSWAYHDTQQYFEQAYALRIKGVLALRPGRAADAARLLAARADILQGGAICVLTEAGLPTDNLSILTAGTGTRVAELDSLGVRLTAGPDLYEAVMRHNVEAMRRCFQPGPGER